MVGEPTTASITLVWPADAAACDVEEGEGEGCGEGVGDGEREGTEKFPG